MRLVFALALIPLLGIGTAVSAQDKTAVAASEKLKSILEATKLDAAGIKPWHWKMDVTTYDSDGSNPQIGTIEAWFAEGSMRTVYTLGNSQMTTVRLGDQLYRNDVNSAKFVPLEILFMNALSPVPHQLLNLSINLKLVQQTAGKTKLDCVQPTFTLPVADTFVVSAPLSYCTEQGTDHFLVAYTASQGIIARLQIGTFQGKQVPMILQLNALSKRRVEAKTTILEVFTLTADNFAVSSSMNELDPPIEIPQQDQLLGLFLNKDAPHYPAVAKSRHAEGSVKFNVLIDTDGRISSEELTNKADPALVEAAKGAMSHWIYRPYLINGVAVPVKTSITINFNLGS